VKANNSTSSQTLKSEFKNEVYNTLMHHIVNTYKKKSSCTVVWLVGVDATTSRRAVELISLGVGTTFSFELVAHNKYHALLPTPRLSKKGTTLDQHISHA
jgi:hypothetical protein